MADSQRSRRPSLEAALAGSPYSIPDDSRGAYLLEDLLPRAAELEARCVRVRQQVAEVVRQRASSRLRISEIYESNAIEGLGTSLRETEQILEGRDLLTATAAMARHALQEVLANEPRITDVVGLAAARLLVDQFVADPSRPLSEADLREMHGLVLAGHPGAGRYKQYINSIEGSTHQPPAPTDVPDHMRSLATWMADTDLPHLWRSAVAHAWLAHIHPFDDGNGRVARLVANYILGPGAFPPLIIRASSDRGRYIDALAHSDSAGDVVPLVRLFVRVLTRAVSDLEDPEFALRLFQADVESRGGDLFARWSSQFDAFIADVSARALLAQYELTRIGSLSASDFQRLRARDRGGNGWLAKAKRRGGLGDVLLWFGFMGPTSYRQVETDEVFPSVFVSVRDRSPMATHPYRPMRHENGEVLDEFTLMPDEDQVVVRRGDRVTKMSTRTAAQRLADVIRDYGDRAEQ